MPTFFIRLPEAGEERNNLDLLLNGLEKMYEVITFNVIGVVADDARVEPILADLAMAVEKGKKAVIPAPIAIDKPKKKRNYTKRSGQQERIGNGIKNGSLQHN